MKRKLVKPAILLIALVMLLSVSGCIPVEKTGAEAQPSAVQPQQGAESTPSSAEKTNKPVTITYWHTYGDAEEPFFNDTVLPLFQEKYPYISVESLRQEGGQYNQLIVAAFGTKQTPDAARIDLTNVAAYASQGGLLSLDEMEGFAELKAQCLDGPMATNLFRGKYYGLPLDTNCKAAVMNMDVMAKLGFTQAPATMEEFIEASRNSSAGKYTLNVSGTGDWDTYPYFWLFGGKLTDDGFTKATGYMDSPESIAALQTMIDLHDAKVFTIRDIDGTPDAWDGIQTGEYAMFFEGPWFFSSIPSYADKNIIPAPIPAYNGKSASVVGGEDIVIFKDSKNPEAAFEFIKFMLSEQVQMMMASKGQMPILKSAAEKDQIRNSPVYSAYQKQLESAQTRIPSPQNTTIGQIWSDCMMKALKGEATAEAALKEAAALIDAELVK